MYSLYIYVNPLGMDDPMFCSVNENVRNKFINKIPQRYSFETEDELCKFMSIMKEYIYNSIKIDCERTSLYSKLLYQQNKHAYVLYFDIDWHDYYETEIIDFDEWDECREKNIYYIGGEENEKTTKNVFARRTQ